jgi:hypothetical protein
MIARFIVPAVVVGALAVASPAHAVDRATSPAVVKGTTALYPTDVATTVTVDGPAVIRVTNVAYRHAEQVQVTRTVTQAGTYTVRDRCQPYLLPHTWIVYVDGVVVATAKLKCR